MTNHLKAKGEALAAEIELTCQTIAVFARYARSSRERGHLAAGGAYLNIGLKAGTAPYQTNVPVFDALRAVRRVGGKFHHSTIQKSDTENTLVIELDGGLTRRALYDLAGALGQEAVAQCMYFGDDRQWGELVGPKAEAWGAFNPQFFLLLDGGRLSAL